VIAIDGLVLFVLARSWRIGSSYNSTIAIHALVHGRNGEECDQHGRLTLIQPRTQRGAERLDQFRSARTLHTIERLYVENQAPHHDTERCGRRRLLSWAPQAPGRITLRKADGWQSPS
jgi:hypothetical protein